MASSRMISRLSITPLKSSIAAILFVACTSLSTTAQASFFGCDALVQRSGHSHFYPTEEAARNQCESVSPSGACFATGGVNSSRPLRNHTYFYCTTAGSNDNSTVFFAFPNTPCAAGDPDINTGACGPDLEPSLDIVAGPPAYSPGDLVEFSLASVRNNGGTTMDPTAAGVFLSTDGTFDLSDTVIAGDIPVPAIDPNTEHSILPFTFNVPDVPTGNYFILLVANTGNVPEPRTDNNTASVAITIENLQPDLVPEIQLAISNGEFGVGEILELQRLAIDNDGTGEMQPTTAGIYISADGTFDPSDQQIASLPTPAIAAGETHEFSLDQNLTVPNLPVGSYSLLFVANIDNLAESDLSNNTANDSFSVVLRQPDLTAAIQLVEVNPQLRPGDEFQLQSLAVDNEGDGEMEASTAAIFVSADSTWDPSDTQISGDLAIPVIPANQSYAVPLPGGLVVPELAPNSYFLLFVANINGLEESDLTNNTAVQSFTVVVPDLTADIQLVESNPEVRRGDEFQLQSLTISNDGTAEMEASTAAIFVSDDTAWDNNDQQLGTTLPVPTIAAGEFYEIPLPSSLAVPELEDGPYFLLLVANVDNLAELDLANNVDAEAFTVLELFPDLVATIKPLHSNQAPIELFPGQSLDVVVEIGNISPTADYEERFEVAAFLSNGENVRSSDPRFAFEPVNELAAKGEVQISQALQIPDSQKAGSYKLVSIANPAAYFEAQAGGDPQPEEEDFANNASEPLEIEVLLPKVEIEFCIGNPISTNSGRKIEREIDYQGAGVFPLQFARFYSSRPGNSSGWRFSYTRRLVVSENNGVTDVILILDGGERYEFLDVENRGYSDPDVPGLVIENDTGYAYLDADGAIHQFDFSGRLVGVTNINGFQQSLQYVGDQLVSVTDHFGKSISLSYNPDGLVSSLTTPDLRTYGYEYNLDGLLSRVILPDNTTREYLYESPNLAHGLTGVIDENGRRYSTFDYDEQGRAILSTHANGADRNTVTYGDNETTVTNALGKNTTYFFEEILGNNRLTRVEGQPTVTCPATTMTSSYDSRGSVVQEVDKNGNVTTYEYTHTGLPDDAYLYQVGLVTKRTEAVGTAEERVTTINWHPDYRLPTEIAEPGRLTTLVYDDNARLISRTELALDTNVSRRWVNTYDERGLLVQLDGPRTDLVDFTSFTYNPEGELTSVTNALGHTTSISAHDGNGLPSRIIDPNGLETELEYDARLRLTTQRVFSGDGIVETQIGYDAKGNVSFIRLPGGQSLNYSYDDADRLVGISNDFGETISFDVDAAGNRTAAITRDAGDNIVRIQSRVFDELSRLISSVGAGNQATQLSYDNNDNLSFVEDALGRRTTLSFDALDRLTSVTDALQGESAFTYDARDNLTSVTDATGVTTYFEYDGHSNLVREISTARGTTNYSYDAAGNRTQIVDANGVTQTLSYDAINRLIDIGYSNAPEEAITYSYDLGVSGVGRLSSITDVSGSTSFKYDDRGNVIEDARVIQDASYVTQYQYNLADQLIAMVYPSGRIITYQLDSLGRVIKVATRRNGAAKEKTVAENISYLPFGPATGWVNGNGLKTSIGYDHDYRVTTINISEDAVDSIVDRAYVYDDVSNITSIVDGSVTDNTQLFEYDELNRLQLASGDYGLIDYEYDAAGNRLSRGIDDDGELADEAYVYEPGSHRLASVTRTTSEGTDERQLSYDANGNLITDDDSERSRSLSINARNRLESVSDDGKVKGEYLYNALGQRVAKFHKYRGRIHAHFRNGKERHDDDDDVRGKKKSGRDKDDENDDDDRENDEENEQDDDKEGGKHDKNRKGGLHIRVDNKKVKERLHFHYDQRGNLIAESRKNGKPVREYIYLGNYRLAMAATRMGKGKAQPNLKKPLKLYFVHNDHLGSPLKVTDAKQRTVWEAGLSPFGDGELTTEGLRMPMRFPGQYADIESGLSYNYFRDYDPTVGRYIQSDPIGIEGGLATYVYANQNPSSYLDRTGEIPILAIALAMAVDVAFQTIANGGDLGKVDLVEVVVAGVTGAYLPGLGSLGRNLTDFLSGSRTGLSDEAAGFLSGALVRGAYSIWPPEGDGPHGRIAIRLEDIFPETDLRVVALSNELLEFLGVCD